MISGVSVHADGELASVTVHHIRLAHPDESAVVRALDDAAFPPGDDVLERAGPGELEEATERGEVHLLLRDREAVAYLHIDPGLPGRMYVSGLGVHPDFQGIRLGTMLVKHFLDSLGETLACVPVIAVTSPRNLPMLSMMTRHGFAARWYLPDFFGPGKHRLCCQLRNRPPRIAPERAHRVPVTDLRRIQQHLDRGEVIDSLTSGPSGREFEIIEPGPHEFLPTEPPPRIGK